MKYYALIVLLVLLSGCACLDILRLPGACDLLVEGEKVVETVIEDIAESEKPIPPPVAATPLHPAIPGGVGLAIGGSMVLLANLIKSRLLEKANAVPPPVTT